MSDKAKSELKSAAITAVVAAGLEVYPILNGAGDWSEVGWYALSFVAARAFVKAVVDWGVQKVAS